MELVSIARARLREQARASTIAYYPNYVHSIFQATKMGTVQPLSLRSFSGFFQSNGETNLCPSHGRIAMRASDRSALRDKH